MEKIYEDRRRADENMGDDGGVDLSKVAWEKTILD